MKKEFPTTSIKPPLNPLGKYLKITFHSKTLNRRYGGKWKVENEWEEHEDDEGRKYYYNRVTNETSWEIIDKVSIEKEVTKEDSILGSIDVIEENGSDWKEVRDHEGNISTWKEVTDEEGNIYYYNPETGLTSWENPFQLTPQSIITEDSATITIQDPSIIVEDPSIIVEDPSIIKDPPITEGDPSITVEDPSITVEDPSIIKDLPIIVEDPPIREELMKENE